MHKLRILITALYVVLGGCAIQDLSGETYSREDARKVQFVESGVVQSVRPVVIEGTTEGLAGVGGGALIGAIAGRTVGDGGGQDLATAVGAIAGSIGGQKAEEKLTRSQGQEIVVLKESGETIAVVQEVVQGKFFTEGDKVRLIGRNGVVRVTL